MADVFKVEGKVTLDSSDFHSAVDKAAKEGQKLAAEVEKQSSTIQDALQNAFSFSVGNLASDAVKEAGRIAMEFAKESVSIASSLQEVQNVVDVTFGDGAKQLEQWAKGARTQFGLTELQAKQYTSTMGAMLKSMGLTESKVYDMSTAMAGLAADMASFYNISFDDAFAKIRSGISGETEPLKQLGINLNIANLEAFALSQGITATYESMTLAEQAMLRYNYILNATADAQGDFARTSDSYANNLRMLETNIDSLKASIGELFLPVVNDVVSAINTLFDSEQSLSERLASADSSFEESTASIAMNDIRANALIDTLDELSQKESLTESEAAQWNETVKRLTEIYPSLSEMIGTNTGELNSSITAIRDETKALKENALEKAKIAVLQDKYNAYVEAAAKAGVAKTAYDDSYAQWDAVVKEIEATKAYLDGKSEYELRFFDMERFQLLVQEEKRLSAETVELEKVWSVLDGEMRASEQDMQKTEAAIAEIGATVDGTNNVLAGSDGFADGMAGAGDNTISLKSKLEDLLKEGKSVQKMFDELEEYKLDNFNSIQKKVEGVYGSFEKAGRVRKTTSKKMFSNLDSQIEQADRFQEAYETLQGMGANDTLMSQFDYSTESIAQMEALIKSGTDGIATATAKLDELKAKENEITTSLSETALAVDTEYQEMITAATEAYDELQTKEDEILSSLDETAVSTNEELAKIKEEVEQTSAVLQEKYAGILENAAMMQATVTEGATTASSVVNELQSTGDALGESKWEPEIKAQDYATSVIKKVEKELEELDGKRATVYIDVVQNGNVPGFATGLDYVPYDDFYARLHEGEAVLTKEEANRWRKGENRSGGEQPINVTLNITGVSSNPYEIAGEVKNALELMRWQG